MLAVLVGGRNEGGEAGFFAGGAVADGPVGEVAVLDLQEGGVLVVEVVRHLALAERLNVQADVEAVQYVAEGLDGASGFGGGAAHGAVDGEGSDVLGAAAAGGLTAEGAEHDAAGGTEGAVEFVLGHTGSEGAQFDGEGVMGPLGKGVVVPQVGGGRRRYGGVGAGGGCGGVGGRGGEAVSRHWRGAFCAGWSVGVWTSTSLHRSKGASP